MDQSTIDIQDGASDVNVLERAFVAQLRADECRARLDALRREFEEQSDVVALKQQIEEYENERQALIEFAQAEGIERHGAFRLKKRTRTVRTVIPQRFVERFGLDKFFWIAKIPVGEAEREVGKEGLDGVVEKTTTIIGVTVEYERLKEGH